MIISKHAIERTRGRFPSTKNWSEEVLIRRLKDARRTAVLEDMKGGGSSVWLSQLKSGLHSSFTLFLVERDHTIVSVYF